MGKKKLFIILSIISILVGWISQGLTLEKSTHEAINQDIAQRAIDEFSLNNTLMNNLGFKGGVEELLSGYSEKAKKEMQQEVWRWLGEGGVNEDVPDGLLRMVVNQGRSNNHFHNPLRANWDMSGL
ncbi:MAG: hypothetical protein OEW45_11835, partial [Deltaproteobacteria bacterium]|nr:hypothetical protein [Deltaproteobacteria bacterium]